MPPISYQGPMQDDVAPAPTHSQTLQANLGTGQPGVTVSAVLGDKGSEVFTVSPNITILEAIGELNRLRVGVLVVSTRGKKPEGVVSERDIVRGVQDKGLALFGLPVSAVMTTDPVTCGPDDKVQDIMKTMTERRFRHMPVMKRGRLCGIISIGDAVRHRLNELEYENLKIKQAMVG